MYFVKPGPRSWFVFTAYKKIPADFELTLWQNATDKQLQNAKVREVLLESVYKEHKIT